MGRGDPPQDERIPPGDGVQLSLAIPFGVQLLPAAAEGSRALQLSHAWAPGAILSFEFVVSEPFHGAKGSEAGLVPPSGMSRSRGDPSPNPAQLLGPLFPHRVAFVAGFVAGPELRPRSCSAAARQQPRAPRFHPRVATFPSLSRNVPLSPKRVRVSPEHLPRLCGHQRCSGQDGSLFTWSTLSPHR